MSDEKRGRGRPVLPDREKRSEHISTMVTPQERKLIERAVAKSGKKLSSWLRELALSAAKKTAKKIQRKP